MFIARLTEEAKSPKPQYKEVAQAWIRETRNAAKEGRIG
jgi:hypothetical protein